uniref:Uncharacterized protein TCIL3000_5_1610 n=1 Tax=Trypanosoma congolense (strain IL3000) TaxID=1068625 RepID=G0UMQ0_TRYCI|nr:unnamed protein product [Trypanosoma congolense IL3000]
MVLLRPNADSNAVVVDGPVSMRILFLVGFPDTEVFLRSLHQRLHAALETTEADINRLLKGDDDEMGSAACALGKYTTRVGTANSASRKKGNRVSLSQCSKKGGTSRSLTSDCEENPPVRSRVYPPLCLVGTFLQYDIPSRYQRMRDMRTRSAQNSAEIPLFIPNAMGTRSVSNVSSAMGHSEEDSGGSQAEWTVQRLRLELIQQDHQMRQSWKTWCNNVSKCTLLHPAEVERSHHHDKGKRRTRQSMTSSRSNDQGTINPSPAPPSQGHTVPKVLFFQRREIAPDNVEHSDVLLYLVLSLKCSLRLISNCLADGSLVAGQLAAPLKLSDYRHPAATLAQLSEHNDRFHVRWNDVTPSIFRKVRNSSMFSVASQPQSGQLSSSACSGENSTAWEDAMLLEAEMYRVFHLNASDLLCFLTREVFPPSLWAAKFPPEASTNMTITSTDEFSSRTLHFMALDENYQMSCDALRSLMSEGLTELSATGALLLSRVIDTTLMEVGEGLKRFAAWCFSHMTSLPYLKQVADGDSPSPGSATSPSTVAFSICDTPVLDQKLNFLSCVPRLDFNELLGEVHRLDGQPESLERFQRFVWSYSSRVHEFALAWLHECTETIACRLGVTVPPSMKINAPYVVHALLAKLFAAAPLATNGSHPVAAGEGDGVLLSDGVPNPLEAAYKNVLHSMKSPSISVSIGRLMASIGSLKRCCMISAVCAARWVDAMYAKALKVPPAEKLPAECRPANIAAIFTPPACPQEDLASHSLMAVQMLTPLAPNFTFDPQRNCNCWEETGMEVILQSFSTHQKSIVSGEEFVHSILQAQLKCIWKLLPDRLHELTARLGVPFSLPTRVNRSNLAVEGDTLDSLLRWIRLRYCKSSAETPLLTEDDCWHIFRSASRSQKQAPPCIENTTKPHQQRLPSVVLLEGSAGRPLKRITLHLQEFFAGLIFRRSCHSDISSDCDYMSMSMVEEPSTKELRDMIRSLPPALLEQGPDRTCGNTSLSLEEWRRIKWWRFSSGAPEPLWDDFVKRYLFRILTVSFELKNGELCSRNVPLLPDFLSVVVRTRGVQATVERYFHALVAFTAMRAKKSRPSPPAEPSSRHSGAGRVSIDLTASSSQCYVAGNCPMAVFDMTLSVDEVLYFFQAGAKGPSTGQIELATYTKLYPPLRLPRLKHRQAEGHVRGGDEGEEVDEDDALSLEADLTLLLEMEGCSGLSLPLLGSSHWGRYVMPRLVAI